MSSTSSTCARASHAAVTCRWLAQPAIVHHWVSSTQYGSWWGSHLYQHLQALIPVTLWGCFLFFVPLRSILRELTQQNVELASPRSSVCLCLYWLWFRPAKLLCSCKDHGQLLQGSFLKNPGTPAQVSDISWLWQRLTSCVACRNTSSSWHNPVGPS